ncbi:TPA: ead/Ea22-like family protein [Escherichia coli]|nr:ead/Ea22-like family protein [Escherichia coli O25b:H4-ST131]HAL7648707.1 ead/Ea22-like family protein [Escherichia coli]HEH7457644.1 ead/Ea22-like family protein [Escherichia coli]
MSEINYQALREVAERAIPAMERLLMLPADDDLLSEQELKDYGVDIDALNAFKFLTGPETVLALLDERERNLQYIKSRDQENEEIALTVGKLRVELEAAKSKLNEQREYYEGVISDGSKRIAELESGSQAQKLVEAIIVAIENEQERLFDEDYLMDSKECIDVIREEVKRWNDSRAAGIRIKGE